MATRPCLRCGKLVPEAAAFCRRCGLSLRERGPAGSPASPTAAASVPTDVARRTRPGLAVAGSMLTVMALLALFTASIPRAASLRPSDPGPPVEVMPGTDAGQQRLARLRERLAPPHERIAWARQRLAAARQRFHSGPASPRPAGPVAEPSTAFHRGATRPDRPRITGLSHGRGRARQWIVVEGAGLAGTSRVLFAAVGDAAGGWAEAAFRWRDDGRLSVRVPDLGRAPRAASVVVLTPAGAAVLLPDRDAPEAVPDRYSFVPPGATLAPPLGAAVLVDNGGWASGPSGSLVVVRAGGGVFKARADCLIVRETLRPQPRDLSATPVLDVPAVVPCFVDSLFQYSGR